MAAWQRWADCFNDASRRRRHLVTTLRCAECGGVLGGIVELYSATVLGAIDPDRQYRRFRLLGVTNAAGANVTALRAASVAITELTCPAGHQRPLVPFLLQPIETLRNRRTHAI